MNNTKKTSFLRRYARYLEWEVGQTEIPWGGFVAIACSCGQRLRRVPTATAAHYEARHHFADEHGMGTHQDVPYVVGDIVRIKVSKPKTRYTRAVAAGEDGVVTNVWRRDGQLHYLVCLDTDNIDSWRSYQFTPEELTR